MPVRTTSRVKPECPLPGPVTVNRFIRVRSDTWQLEQQNDQAGGFLVSTRANKKKEYSDVVQTKNYPRLGNQSIFKFKF